MASARNVINESRSPTVVSHVFRMPSVTAGEIPDVRLKRAEFLKPVLSRNQASRARVPWRFRLLVSSAVDLQEWTFPHPIRIADSPRNGPTRTPIAIPYNPRLLNPRMLKCVRTRRTRSFLAQSHVRSRSPPFPKGADPCDSRLHRPFVPSIRIPWQTVLDYWLPDLLSWWREESAPVSMGTGKIHVPFTSFLYRSPMGELFLSQFDWPERSGCAGPTTEPRGPKSRVDLS